MCISLVELLGTIYAANDFMAGLLLLYAEVFGFVLFILFSILFILEITLYFYNSARNKRTIPFTNEQETLLDIVFLIFPTFVILYLLVPTLGFIFNSDFSVMETFLDINVIGHQWYWTYEYTSNIEVVPGLMSMYIDHNILQIDSFMDTDTTINRLLEVTNRLVLPIGYFIGLHITATDVIHSFAIPQLGIKIDAIPGRIAQTILLMPNEGIYRGQCSELCGAYHGFMPIVIESIALNKWYIWYCANLKINPANMFLELINVKCCFFWPLTFLIDDVLASSFRLRLLSCLHTINLNEIFHELEFDEDYELKKALLCVLLSDLCELWDYYLNNLLFRPCFLGI